MERGSAVQRQAGATLTAELLGILLAGVFLSGCHAGYYPASLGPIDRGPPHQIVRVFYATDRRRADASDNPYPNYPFLLYGSRSSDSLQLGTVFVNVPSTAYGRRLRGQISHSPFWRVNPFGKMRDSLTDMFVTDVRLMDANEFFGTIDSIFHATLTIEAPTVASRLTQKSLLVFVHGYDVTFEDAALRTAQITVDLGFDGVPLFYSWPSAGAKVGYAADEGAADNSAFQFARFLRDLARRAGAEKIHILGHSMGARVIIRGLMMLHGADPAIHINQLVLSEADIDWREVRNQLDAIRLVSSRFTIYASARDKALALSRSFHGGIQPLGLGGDGLTVLPGMDTIDATDVRTDLFGHGDFGTGAFLDDLRQLIDFEIPPDRRSLTPVPPVTPKYWRFEPALR